MLETHDDLAAPLARAGLPPPLPRPPGAVDPQADPFAPLLEATAAMHAAAAPGPRRRLLERVCASAASSRALYTRRHADTVASEVAPGVTLRALYRAAAGQPRRPGEPDAVTLVELAPGASWSAVCTAHGPRTARGGRAASAGDGRGLQREWLVLRGSLDAGGTPLRAHDYHVLPADAQTGAWSSRAGALLYLRESLPADGSPAWPSTQRAEAAEWADYAPGIKRRLMWRQGAQAAMLYHALPGAAVPHHGHRHDEECLMLAGDFFLDEVLLRTLDYQIAPAGTEHQVSSTDTGVLIYAHGDIDLDLK